MDLKELISNQTKVSLTLSTNILPPDTNSIISPLSIQLILGLLASGSTGPAQAQLLSFLKSKSTQEVNSLSSQLVDLVFKDGSILGGPKVSFVNGVWVDQSMQLKDEFKDVVEGVYKAGASQVDFKTKHVEVTSEVNQWAENETAGLIKEVLPPGSVDHFTRLIFANALYFKGAWKEKFDASMTKDHEFHLLNGTSIHVPFMTSKKMQYLEEFDDFKVLGLPYEQGEDKRSFTMYFFLPDAKDGLPSLLSKIGYESEFIDDHIPYEQAEVVNFMIPKFKMSFEFEASTVLKRLGLVSPFSGDGLTDMVDSPVREKLYVSSIFHKSFIEVNEEGTEAAAVSAAVINARYSAGPEKMDFVADHPFLFVIRENITGVLLFSGQVLDPSS